MRKIKLCGNLVAITPVPHNAHTAVGILLTERHKPAQQIWRVIEVGTGFRKKNGLIVPIELKPGDKVLTPEIVNNRAVFTDDVQIVDAREILAVVEELHTESISPNSQHP